MASPTETSSLQFDPVSGKGTLKFSRGPHAGFCWAVQLSVCPSPLCGCRIVNCECAPLAAPEAVPGGIMRSPLEVEKRKISMQGRIRPTGKDLALAKWMVAELGDADWQALFNFLILTKQKIVEEADASHLDADFPEEVMEGEGSMVGYFQIFPLANGFPFEIEGQNWQIDDQYCVEPGCKCQRVLLSFLPMGIKAQPVRNLIGNPPAAFYEYKRNKLEVLERPAEGQPSLRALLQTVKQTYQDFDSAISKRRLQLRALFVRALSGNLSRPQMRPTRELMSREWPNPYRAGRPSTLPETIPVRAEAGRRTRSAAGNKAGDNSGAARFSQGCASAHLVVSSAPESRSEIATRSESVYDRPKTGAFPHR